MVGSVIGWGNAGREEPLVASIVVRQSSFESGEDTKIVSEVVDFVNRMLQQGLYLRSELPPNALRAFHTDFYLAQVANGGHGQFVGNSRWAPAIVQDIREGLSAMNAAPYEAIFSDLCTLIESDSRRAKQIADGGGFGDSDPEIKKLDGRFFQHDVYRTFSPIIARWLRSLPELEVVPDDDIAKRLKELCEANPQFAERRLARHELALNENLQNPIWVAGRLLCLNAGCMPVLSIGGGDPSAITPDGEQVTAWQLQTAQGRRMLQIGRSHAVLCETYLLDGTKLTDEVVAQMRQEMLDGRSENMARFAEMEQREVARIPTKVVETAISTARSVPIVRIAKELLEKLDTGETLEQVFAGGVLANGSFMWIVETDKRALLFSFRDGDAVLTDIPPTTDLATVSLAELKSRLDRERAGRA